MNGTKNTTKFKPCSDCHSIRFELHLISCGNSAPEIEAIFTRCRRLAAVQPSRRPPERARTPSAMPRSERERREGKRELTSHRSTLPSAPRAAVGASPSLRLRAQIRAVRRKTSAECEAAEWASCSRALNRVAKLAQGRVRVREVVAKPLWNPTLHGMILKGADCEALLH